MIKNAFIYRLTGAVLTASAIEDALRAGVFVPCAGNQEKSAGWVPPREEYGLLLEAVAGQWILKLMTETKSVPLQAITDAMAEHIKRITDTTGRKPGKKEKRELMDDVRLQLLPHAFPKRTATLIWIDPAAGLLVVDASTQAKADEAISALVYFIDGFTVQSINTETSPAASMAHWLHSKEAPQGFSVDRECELKACDESKAVVRFSRHALDTDEVAEHIAMGKMPTRLALTWGLRVSFVLTEHLQIKKIDFFDVVFADHYGGNRPDADDRFDADVAIMSGELRMLIPELLEALGGEVRPAGDES
jgi:recombination associated protein RdgC